MGYPKDMVSIIGQMVVFIREILIMGLDMVLGCGKIIRSCIKGIINMIKKMGLVFICGKKKKSIKEGLGKIINKAMDRFMSLVGILNNPNYSIKEAGLKGKSVPVYL